MKIAVGIENKMKDEKTDQPPKLKRLARGLITILAVIIVLIVLAAVAIPILIPNRNTAGRDACLRNLRMIDAGKRQWELEHSTSVGKMKEENANQSSEATPKPGAPQ